MKSVEPWGTLATASILVIGHDPRLLKSGAEAKKTFFFEYLDGQPPRDSASRAKYNLAKAVVDYVGWLAKREIPKDQLYVTNLCRKYLDRGPKSGTILIPDSEARAGILAIRQAVTDGHFKVILPMSVQVFYHLCQFNFIDESTDVVKQFEALARPSKAKAEQGIYVSAKPAPFLRIVGKQFYHHGIPVIPILHIKQWRGDVRVEKYRGPMEDARKLVCAAIEMD